MDESDAVGGKAKREGSQPASHIDDQANSNDRSIAETRHDASQSNVPDLQERRLEPQRFHKAQFLPAEEQCKQAGNSNGPV